MLAEAENAIIVSPTYRLLPEATGSDILEDVKDFWQWTRDSLPTFLAEKWPSLKLDLGHTAVTGESAGGYLALQSGFLFPSANIRVVMAQYPTIYPDIEWVPRPVEIPTEAQAVVDAYIAKTRGNIRLQTPWPAMMDFGEALRKTGKHHELMGDDERLTLEYALRTVEALPPLWIIQGTEDRIVSLKAILYVNL